MKTFKDLLNEVAEPKGGDEKRFKAKHIAAKYDHPSAEEDQFVAKTKKKKREADLEDGEDEDLYESHFEVGDEVECIKSGMEGVVVEVDPEEKGKYYTVKREDGKLVKYAPDELRAEDEDEEDDEDEDEDIAEEEMTDAEMKKREEIVKSMKDKKAEFQKRYGDKWKSVMYATATKQAMKESVELEENKNLLKDYQDMKAQGKKDSNIIDALMSMPKYKKMSRDQMAKAIGDAKRKGIFKEEVELNEDVIADLKKIVSSKTRGDVKFSDGNKLKVDMFTASAMVKVHDALNAANQKKFADAINKDEAMFMKMVDFAFSKVK